LRGTFVETKKKEGALKRMGGKGPYFGGPGKVENLNWGKNFWGKCYQRGNRGGFTGGGKKGLK